MRGNVNFYSVEAESVITELIFANIAPLYAKKKGKVPLLSEKNIGAISVHDTSRIYHKQHHSLKFCHNTCSIKFIF